MGVSPFHGGGAVDLLDTLRPLAEEACRELGLDLWEVRWQRRTLYVTADRPGGLTLDDCEALSNRLSELLDAVDVVPGPYTLDVASPGLDRRLRHLGDVSRFAGERAEVVYRTPEGERTEVGRLGEANDDSFVLHLEGGDDRVVPWADVRRVQLKPTFGKGERR
jgi:ribosome maturation factor RimP